MKVKRFTIEYKPNGTCDCVDLLTGERSNWSNGWVAQLDADKKYVSAYHKGEQCEVEVEECGVSV